MKALCLGGAIRGGGAPPSARRAPPRQAGAEPPRSARPSPPPRVTLAACEQGGSPHDAKATSSPNTLAAGKRPVWGDRRDPRWPLRGAVAGRRLTRREGGAERGRGAVGGGALPAAPAHPCLRPPPPHPC
ncbi:hypothetical protein I4F81_007141 [Pyropia yezoensis]|uniref:Uncharacterized protein n=1 Tax=Pyropia yezoensis TaxID=2788 RepID=A0ACC3C3R8_PYRYE|nr:hypothetical protein I4F81_007141 [Neopyropia yezoensis]